MVETRGRFWQSLVFTELSEAGVKTPNTPLSHLKRNLNSEPDPSFFLSPFWVNLHKQTLGLPTSTDCKAFGNWTLEPLSVFLSQCCLCGRITRSAGADDTGVHGNTELYSRITGPLEHNARVTDKRTSKIENRAFRCVSDPWTNLWINALLHVVQILNNASPRGAKAQANSRASFPGLRSRCCLTSWVSIWRSHGVFLFFLFWFCFLFCFFFPPNLYPVQLVDGNACIFISPVCQSHSSGSLSPPPPPPFLSTAVNTPGETNRWQTWKKAGFVPCEVILSPDPNPWKKQIHRPTKGRHTHTRPRRRPPG